MATQDQAPESKRPSTRPSDPAGPPSHSPRTRRRSGELLRAPEPGAAPGTLLVTDHAEGARPHLVLLDYDGSHLEEKELSTIDEALTYLADDRSSVTWLDVRGLSDRAMLERMGEIFVIHPLALEDLVNAPQRPKTEAYPRHQVIISRSVCLGEAGDVASAQLGIVLGKRVVLTVQEDPTRDVLAPVRERLRRGQGKLRDKGADHLAYALLDAVIDGFYPVLEALGERLDDLETAAAEAPRTMSRSIHDVKRDLLTVRRAVWPQRDLLNGLLRDESLHLGHDARTYLRDTYDHTVEIVDLVETFREVASGLMELYLSGVSNRTNEIMKVLTILSTIFLPLTFIAGLYGMNFKSETSRWNMPELGWEYGYPFALALMAASTVTLVVYYRRKGWIGRSDA